MKKLKYSRLQWEPGPRGARALLTVKFMDDGGEVYNWMPTWSEAEQLFLKAINTESFNKPESEWLSRFAKTVQETAESANQPIGSARKLTGTFTSLEEGKLVITGERFVLGVRPLFQVTTEFLDDFLGTKVDLLVINEVGVQVTQVQHPGIVFPPSPSPYD